MVDPLAHLSTFAEDAVADIRLMLHEYTTARSAERNTLRAGRFAGKNLGFGDRATQLAIANIVGVVEHYAEQVLLDAGCSAAQVTTWGNKPGQWKKIFSADIEASCSSFPAMRGYYEARNAIMHRRGELTDSQRKKAVYDRLAAAGIERVAYDIVVTPKSVSACADVCIACVGELDSTTR